MQTLRNYQTEQVEKVFDAVARGYNRVVYTAPGGVGKTTTFAEITRRFLGMGKKVLILVDSRELVFQAYDRVSQQCSLSHFDIGVEKASLHFSTTNRVVIAMIQTIRQEHRLAEVVAWKPDVVIVDEAHVSAAAGYKLVYERLGVYRGECLQIGTTATLKRLDKVSLAAIKPDGNPYTIEDAKTKESRSANLDESIYQVHCSDYSLIDAVEQGWLVEPKGRTLPAPIDLSKLHSAKNKEVGESDFILGELALAVDKEDVNDTIVSAWKKDAEDRPTIAYCCSIHHAQALAQKFIAAGISALSIDGTTPDEERDKALSEFRNGSVKVLTNFGVYGKGVDLPNCGCILVARPTKSWSLYVQWVYRGTRVLPGVVDDMGDALPEQRRLAIEASAKPYMIVLDLVGNSGRHKPCTLPVILDLPADLDLQGHGVVDAHKLLKRHADVAGQVIGEHPKTFKQLEVRLEEVDLLSHSGAKSRRKWKATGEGYYYTKTPPGYSAKLLLEEGRATLEIKRGERGLLTIQRPYGSNISGYLDSAEERIQKVIKEEQARVKVEKQYESRGTLERLTYKQKNVLLKKGFKLMEIDAMPYAKASAIIKKAVFEYKRMVGA